MRACRRHDVGETQFETARGDPTRCRRAGAGNERRCRMIERGGQSSIACDVRQGQIQIARRRIDCRDVGGEIDEVRSRVVVRLLEHEQNSFAAFGQHIGAASDFAGNQMSPGGFGISPRHRADIDLEAPGKLTMGGEPVSRAQHAGRDRLGQSLDDGDVAHGMSAGNVGYPHCLPDNVSIDPHNAPADDANQPLVVLLVRPRGTRGASR